MQDIRQEGNQLRRLRQNAYIVKRDIDRQCCAELRIGLLGFHGSRHGDSDRIDAIFS